MRKKLKTDKLEECKKIAEQRGGKCLSDKYIDSSTELYFQCKNLHPFYETPYNLKNKNCWC